MTSSERQTITAAIRGEPEALESLFGRNLAPLVAFVRVKLGTRLAAREAAEDIALSVCREALVDLPRFEDRGEDAFRNWLVVRAVRKIADRHRYHRSAMRDVERERRVDPSGPDADENEAGADPIAAAGFATLVTPSHHAVAREELARVERAVLDLPEGQRDAIVMSRILGLPTAACATELGCSESAVRGLIARGLTAVSAALTGDADPAPPSTRGGE